MIAFAIAIVVVFLLTLVKSLLAEEIRGRLDRLPGWLLRHAAKHLGPEQQMTYDEMWLPDLAYILSDAEGRPITRLVTGIRFAVGLLVSTRREARHSQRAVSEETVLELRNPAQPEIALIEDISPGPDTPVIIRRDPGQPSPFFHVSPGGGPAPTAPSSFFETYNGGPVATVSNGSGYRPAYNGGAVPTTVVAGGGYRSQCHVDEWFRGVAGCLACRSQCVM
jgi:hypothetical protein